MSKIVRETIAQNLRHPVSGLGGWFVNKFGFERINVYLEHNAVKLCDIQPHSTVLEVGFGPGIGLAKAADIVKDGSGSLYGVEISELMIKKATERLQTHITAGKVQLYNESVTKLPFQANMFDCVFHVNCYYFWPDLDVAAQELYRVMKPHSQMITTRNCESLRDSKEKGFMKYAKTDAEPYMAALKRNGFESVKIEDLKDDADGKPYQAIFAAVGDKA